MSSQISIKGAREHNLKNVSVDLPRDSLIVFCGISGSGKSSLAFDTIYAEGQRRYVESLSAYARQFLGQMDKPDVEFVEGLSPAISIDQKSTSRNPRSTVGTITEVYDYLRLLFARVGVQHCPSCGQRIESQTNDQIVTRLESELAGERLMILAPVVTDRKGEYESLLADLARKGFVRARVDGEIVELGEKVSLDRKKRHTIEVVVDRIALTDSFRQRLAESVETAATIGLGTVIVEPVDQERRVFSLARSCLKCGLSFEDHTPRFFSFNTPYGACPTCLGLGNKLEIDPHLVLAGEDLSIAEGVISAWGGNRYEYFDRLLAAVCRQQKVSPKTPWKKIPKSIQKKFLYGIDGWVEVTYTMSNGRERKFRQRYEGVIPWLQKRHESSSDSVRERVEQYMREVPCSACKGARLKPEALAVTINALNISQVSEMSIGTAVEWFDTIGLTGRDLLIAERVLKEIRERLGFLLDVGLHYLTLSRAAATLAGGEAQRIRLATQIGSGLVGVLYVLDEPSIGLHQRDNRRLIDTLFRLRDQGNTVIVVEHDEETVRAADFVVDLGPGAGEHGGEIVFAGPVEGLIDHETSLTGAYLAGTKKIPVPKKRRKPTGELKIIAPTEHNLKGDDATIAVGCFNCVTGVSGSGKSTLVHDIVHRALASQIYNSRNLPGKHKSIVGAENFDKVILMDQAPIGRTPRSNPATYTGVFDYIRKLFSQTPEAKRRGYTQGRFSFNVRGGRCEACTGEGTIKIEMHFLPDVYVPCEQCGATRYNRETLEVRWKGATIADVLQMPVSDAREIFEAIPPVARHLKTLEDVGLGYIRLGQPATTLSGGEAQRVKLASELAKRSTGRTIYILDEPTTGLHFEDVRRLVEVLHRLVDTGNTVVVIEHNLDVIKTADYIIDLGPEGGDGGGRIMAAGTPEKVAKTKGSYTGEYLAKILR